MTDKNRFLVGHLFVWYSEDDKLNIAAVVPTERVPNELISDSLSTYHKPVSSTLNILPSPRLTRAA